MEKIKNKSKFKFYFENAFFVIYFEFQKHEALKSNDVASDVGVNLKKRRGPLYWKFSISLILLYIFTN